MLSANLASIGVTPNALLVPKAINATMTRPRPAHQEAFRPQAEAQDAKAALVANTKAKQVSPIVKIHQITPQ